MLTLASASGNTFAYAWELPPGLDGPGWAQALCAAHKLDGLFLLARPVPGGPSHAVLEDRRSRARFDRQGVGNVMHAFINQLAIPVGVHQVEGELAAAIGGYQEILSLSGYGE